MPWYAADAIMYIRFKSGKQETYPIWENVLLINARTPASAWRKAEARAKQDEGDSGGTFRWGRRPAEWVFAGLRKLVAVSHPSPEVGPRDGDEITYSEFKAANAAYLKKLVAGKVVSIEYVV
jgi:hypothetical protein